MSGVQELGQVFLGSRNERGETLLLAELSCVLLRNVPRLGAHSVVAGILLLLERCLLPLESADGGFGDQLAAPEAFKRLFLILLQLLLQQRKRPHFLLHLEQQVH